MINLVLVGLNHRSAPLPVRERLFVPRGDLPGLLDELRGVEGVDEGLVLSTCNRTEFLARVSDAQTGSDGLERLLLARGQAPAQDLEGHLYRLRGPQAVRHVFRVASSLDSLVVGEPQILGQVKEAYLLSVEHRTLGRVLDGLMRHAFEVAKKVRTSTGIARHPVSVGQAAVSLARQIFGSLEGRSVLLLGAGKMGELAARQLVEEGAGRVRVANRTHARALDLAQRFGGEAVLFEERAECCAEVDIVLASTGAPHFILGPEEVAAALRHRRGRPLFIIDIAVPRDVDPRVNDLESVYVYDLDDLERVVDANRAGRIEEAAAAETLIEREVVSFEAWVRGLAAGPAIAAWRERSHQLKDEELERFLSRHRDLPEPQRRELAEMLHGLVNRILHEPTVRLKRALGRAREEEGARLLRDLLGLEDPSPPPSRRAPRSRGPEPY